MPLAELFTVEYPAAGRLSVMARPRGGEWLGDEIAALRLAGVDVLVSLLTPGEAADFELEQEERWCHEHGIEFHALPIRDRGVPGSVGDVDSLARCLADALQAGKHVVAHCRQGIGRSSLMAAAILVTQGCSADQAFGLLERARGRPVPDTWEQREWVEALAERMRNPLSSAQ